VFFFFPYKAGNPLLFGFQNFGRVKNFPKIPFFFAFLFFLSKKSFFFPSSEKSQNEKKNAD
jgi:hypothetical protein